MNSVIKMLFKRLIIGLLFTTPILNAGSGGSAFGGSLAGSMFGSMLGSAMTRPRSRTVVVQSGGTQVSRNEISRLEQNLRNEIAALEDIVRKDLNKLYNRIRALESEKRDLKDDVAELKRLIKHLSPEGM